VSPGTSFTVRPGLHVPSISKLHGRGDKPCLVAVNHAADGFDGLSADEGDVLVDAGNVFVAIGNGRDGEADAIGHTQADFLEPVDHVIRGRCGHDDTVGFCLFKPARNGSRAKGRVRSGSRWQSEGGKSRCATQKPPR